MHFHRQIPLLIQAIVSSNRFSCVNYGTGHRIYSMNRFAQPQSIYNTLLKSLSLLDKKNGNQQQQYNVHIETDWFLWSQCVSWEIRMNK